MSDKPAPKAMDDQWFDDLITKARETQRTPLALNDQLVSISEQLLVFMIANRYQIVSVGKQTFQDFLLLMSKGQSLDALRKIFENLKTSDLVAQYQENAISLEEIDKQDTARREFWFSMLLQLGEKLVPLALSMII